MAGWSPAGAALTGQRGVATVLLVLGVLAVLGAALVTGARLLRREWAMEADARQGDLATLAADSALAWFLTQPATGPVPPEVLGGTGAFHLEAELHLDRLGLLAGDGPPLRLWRLTVTGRCQAPGSPVFEQVREVLLSAPEGAAAGPIAVRAWRCLRGG